MNNWSVISKEDLIKLHARVSPQQYCSIPQRNNKEKASVVDQRTAIGGPVEDFPVHSGPR